MTKALLAGAAARKALSCAAAGAAETAGAEDMLVSAWKTSFCGSLTRKSRLAAVSVLRKPMSESPSMSAPSSMATLPEEICSFKVLAGTLVVIQAGTMAGLKPSSSTL